jgi:hypothetical protein
VSARLLATFCLGICFVSVSSAQSAGSADSELAVYLKSEAGQPSGPVAQMKRDLAALMRTAGYRISWRNPETGAGDDSAFLAVIELNGTCALPAGYADPAVPAVNAISLATTDVTDGQVLPFSSIHCGVLTRSLASLLLKTPAAQRDYFYGRAMARVLAHELYHMLSGSTEHAKSGVARSCFSVEDLVAEHFTFENMTLARMRPRPDTFPSATASGEEATGR